MIRNLVWPWQIREQTSVRHLDLPSVLCVWVPNIRPYVNNISASLFQTVKQVGTIMQGIMGIPKLWCFECIKEYKWVVIINYSSLYFRCVLCL